MNANEKVIITKEPAWEQSRIESIFRLSSRRAEEAEAGPQLVELWNLKRAGPIVSIAEIDDRLGRESRHMICTISCTLLSLAEIL
jgi:hypothetical protein